MSRVVQEMVQEKPFGTRYGYEFYEKEPVVQKGVERIRYTGVRFCPCGRVLRWAGWVHWNVNYPIEKSCPRCHNSWYSRMGKKVRVYHEWCRKPELRPELVVQELHLVLPCTRVAVDAEKPCLSAVTGEVRIVFAPQSRQTYVLDVTGDRLPAPPSVVFSENAREYGFEVGDSNEYVSICQTVYKQTVEKIGRLFQKLTGDNFAPGGGLNLQAVVRLLEAVTLYPQLTTVAKTLGWTFLREAILMGKWKEFDLTQTDPAGILGLKPALVREMRQAMQHANGDRTMEVFYGLKQLQAKIGHDHTLTLFKKCRDVAAWHSLVEDVVRLLGVQRAVRAIAAALDNQDWASNTLIYIRDGVTMAMEMGIPVKIPNTSTGVKRWHDELAGQYRTRKDQITREKFLEAARNLAWLAWQEGRWEIQVPEKPEDLFRESEVLRHCVKSYVSRVANGECAIAMLRKDGNPHVTIEVRNGAVVQAKGFANSQPDREAGEAIRRWAEEKGLRYYG